MCPHQPHGLAALAPSAAGVSECCQRDRIWGGGVPGALPTPGRAFPCHLRAEW